MPKVNAVREEPNRKEATDATLDAKRRISESGAAGHGEVEHVESGIAKLSYVPLGEVVDTKDTGGTAVEGAKSMDLLQRDREH